MNTHDCDFYTWTQQQAALLRAGRLNELDLSNLIEEIEDMGRSEKRELRNRLSVLLTHLLKWTYQPDHRSNRWEATIEHQRFEVRDELSDNPGLKPILEETVKKAFMTARFEAKKETDLKLSTFPAECPWTMDQVLDDEFWPE